MHPIKILLLCVCAFPSCYSTGTSVHLHIFVVLTCPFLFLQNSFNEADCSFTFKEQWIQSNETSYNNNKTVFRLSRLRHHKNRYYVGLYCDGRPIVAKDCRQRRKLRKHLLFTVGDFNPDENAGTCSAIKPPKCKRTYLKFCRKVVQNFFSVSVKEWKKFRAKKCFKRLGREKQRMRKIAEKCNGWSSRPRHPT